MLRHKLQRFTASRHRLAVMNLNLVREESELAPAFNADCLLTEGLRASDVRALP